MEHPVYRVTGFEVVGRYMLRVEFDDDTAQVIDFSDILAGDIYAPLQDEDVFCSVEVDPEIHTLVWPSGADFDPAILHDWPTHASEMRRLAKGWRAAASDRRRAVRSPKQRAHPSRTKASRG